jgi:1-acyl-sn-glycerol-3-phosphate acyltransferase
MKRKTLQKIVRFLLPRLCDVEYQGLEHIPKTGGLIITTNHLSRMDIPFIFNTPARDDITALVADKYKKYIFFRWFCYVAGGIWIDRSKADFTALKLSLEALRAGCALGISPEGTRSEVGELLEGKAGTALIAIKAGVPIIPVALWGTKNSFNQLFHFKRPKMHMRYGPVYYLPSLDLRDREASLKRAVDEIMCRIAVLLPEQYHGFYRGHPRLKELQKALV